MRFDPTAEQSAFLDELRSALEGPIAPRAAAWDREGGIPADTFAAIGASGIFVVPEHGGRGLDTVSYALAMEEIGAHLPALAAALSVVNGHVTNPIARFGSAEQKSRFLPSLARGEQLGALCASEHEAPVRAASSNGSYLLDGESTMVLNGGTASAYLVYASSGAGGAKALSAFFVPADSQGVTRGAREETLGLRAADVRTVRFQGVRVPEAQRIGAEGQGTEILSEARDVARIGIGALAVGIARGALQRAVDFARRTQPSGRSIAEIPMTQQLLAVMATETDAARLLVLQAAQRRDRGEPYTADAARAKLAASESCVRTASGAVQVFGGAGLLASSGVERFYRDAKATELLEGTSETQRAVLAGALHE